MNSYGFAKTLLVPILGVLWRMRVSGAENVPSSGPLIVACNHVSYLDPPALGTACPRQLRYMAKAELFSIPLVGPMIASFGAYPVDRKGSTAAAIKRSVDVLAGGGAIGIFPEGTRNLSGQIEPHRGVALLASLGKAPVVPACVSGSRNALRFAPIKVAFGKPMTLPAGRRATRDDLSKFTVEIMNEIRALAETIGGN